MTVKDLIEELQKHEPEDKVKIKTPAGWTKDFDFEIEYDYNIYQKNPSRTLWIIIN